MDVIVGKDNSGFEFETRNSVYDKNESKGKEELNVTIEFGHLNGIIEDYVNKGGKKTENSDNLKLIYKISDTPPLHLLVLFAIQQVLMSLPGNVIVSVLVANAVCGENDDELKAQLLSTTIFMSALTTLLQVTFGIRLTVYQGPTAAYLIPIFALSSLPEWKCPALNRTVDFNTTMDWRVPSAYREANILPRLQQLQGSLVVAGIVHTLIGLTGLVGLLLRYLGPITVIPTLLLLGIEFYHIVTGLCEAHWAVATGTAIIGLIFAVYLEGWEMPIPLWTRSKGCHIIRYPLQQVLAILFSLGIGWLVCDILTKTGILTNDPNKKEYKTRTDAGFDVVSRTPWFYMPYPGQFGPNDFSAGVFIGFVTAVITSIIDSIADYYACAKMCHVPPPPVHAVNRGIMIEGLMSVVAGFYGAGHGTTTYGGNIGTIGITKVASRSVYQVFSVVLLVLSVCGKFGAVFVTIPDPVLGGSIVIGFGIFIGLILSNLQYINLNSSRNLAVLGVSILVGLMVPNWTKKNSESIVTGSDDFDRLIRMVLTNPTLFGGGLAFLLDNTVKGTKQERGLVAWDTAKIMKSEKKSKTLWEEDASVYEIVAISHYLKSVSFLKYIPIMPNYKPGLYKCK